MGLSLEQPECDKKTIANSLIKLIILGDLQALERALENKNIQAYLIDMKSSDSVVLKLKAHAMTTKKILYRIAELLPAEVLNNKFTTLKPLLFSRMQRNANTLQHLKIPEDLIKKIFKFVYNSGDEFSDAQISQAARGTKLI